MILFKYYLMKKSNGTSIVIAANRTSVHTHAYTWEIPYCSTLVSGAHDSLCPQIYLHKQCDEGDILHSQE